MELTRYEATETTEIECDDSTKTKILIYEDQWFSQIALENILFDQLKLKKHVRFFMNGMAIKQAIKTLFKERNENQVALVILDYKLPGLLGDELITWTKTYLSEQGVGEDEMPHFAFRAQQFYSLPPEKIKDIFDMGIKTDQILEKITRKKQLEKYFKKIGYFYRSLREVN